MTLETDNRKFGVAQSGPDFLILREPATFPAGRAVFSVTIDGETTASETFVAAVDGDVRVRAGVSNAIPARA